MRLALTVALAALIPTMSLAAEVESVQVDAAAGLLTLAGVDLDDVDEVTLTDEDGVETTLKTKSSTDPTLMLAVLPEQAAGTYRLRAYELGTVLDQMDVAVPADATTATFVDKDSITRVSAQRTCSGTVCYAVAGCPRGSRAMSGGYEMVGYYETTVTANYPATASSWRVDVEANNKKAYWTVAKAHAVCVKTEATVRR